MKEKENKMKRNEIKGAFNDRELEMLDPSLKNVPKTKEAAGGILKIREVYNIGQAETDRLNDALTNVFVPHIKTFEAKKLYFIIMLKELLALASNKLEATDRDSVVNQRVETVSSLLSSLFHHLMIKIYTDVRLLAQKSLKKLKKGIPDEKVRKWFSSSNTLTDGFQYSLATGNWNTTFVDRQQRKGVAQALQRLTYISTVSQLRRVSSAVEKTQKLPKPRYLHGSHWGRYCPAETPERTSDSAPP